MTAPTLTPQQKEGIARKLLDAYKASGFTSRAKFAVSIGITSSDFSNIERDKWKENERLLSLQKWLRLAHKVGYEFSARQRWVTAETATYRAIKAQLEMCRSEGLNAMLCDEAGWGKSHAAKEYCAVTPNAFYVNGGHNATKVAFISALAKSVGINPDKSTTEETLNDIITYLKALSNPIIIIDEGGDLHNHTYMLLKRLYNELEFACGMYILGARGLEKRINSGIRNRTNGFEEVYSRFGSRFTTIIPPDPKQRIDFLRAEATLVAERNGLTDPQKLNRILSRDFDLRTIRREVLKTRHAA